MYSSSSNTLNEVYKRQNSSKKSSSSMPEAVQILKTVLGNTHALLRLVQQFGGCTQRIPSRWPPFGKDLEYCGHPFRSAISPKQMQKIVAHYGGTDLYIPKCQKFVQQLRNSAIIKTYCHETQKGASSGKVVQKLAKRYALSDRRVWSILKIDIQTEANNELFFQQNS